MKRLLLCILFTGSLVMAQDTLILKTGQQHPVHLIEIQENNAVIEIKGVGLGAEFIVQSVPLHMVDRIILEDGTVVWTTADSGATGMVATQDTSQSAATKYYSSPQGHQTVSTSASFTVRDLGIVLIAGSGVLGYINNNKECDPCNDIEDVENFADDLKSRANLQYGSLILGALLMLIGEDINLVMPASE